MSSVLRTVKKRKKGRTLGGSMSSTERRTPTLTAAATQMGVIMGTGGVYVAGAGTGINC